MNRLITISILFVLIALSVKAQKGNHAGDATEQLQKQLSVYLAEHPTSNLYLHLDKNIYSPEETIWFKAYLLADTIIDNKVLYVRIVDEYKEIVLSGQFPMYDIRAHGNLDLPKSLEERRYTLYAYTGRMLSYGDSNVFVQPIRIRKKTGLKLEAEAMVIDTSQLLKGGKVQVMARIKESGRSAKNIKGEYELLAGEKSIKYGRLTANQFGEAYINFTYPELEDNQALKVKMLFATDNDYTELSLTLPHQGNPLKVNIRPEGGQLLAGVPGKVAIEVLDIHDNPVSTVLLVKNVGQLVTKVTTNKLGLASIILKPEGASSYTVETATGKKKQIIPFPEVIKPAGYSLKLHKNNGQCTVTIYNKSLPGSAVLVLRSTREILWSKSITIPSGDSLKVPVPAASFPKNILSLSIFDDNNKPQAERLFLNREEEDYNVTIVTDRKDYGMQKKVTVTVNITDRQGNPVVANLSIGVSEKNRIDSTGFRNILQSWYYRPFGQAINRFLSSKSAIEVDGLLAAGSGHYNGWSKISSYISQGPPVRLSNADAAIGLVTKKGIKVKKISLYAPELGRSLAELNKDNISSMRRLEVNLDGNNMFIVPAADLLSLKGNEWVLDDIYKDVKLQKALALNTVDVEWKDHDIQFDLDVLKRKMLHDHDIINSFASVKIPVRTSINFEGLNQLAEVTIGGKEEKIRKRLRDNPSCSDIICDACGALNCTYKPLHMPRKGNVYFNKATGKRIIYLDCGKYGDINCIKNITVPKDFYLPDYDIIPHPNEDVRSTIYWNPNIVTDDNGTATFSFYTSDIQGAFEIMAQGLEVTTFKPLMGAGSFKVTVSE